MVAASGQAAVNNARKVTTCDPGMCLKYVRTWWEIGSRYPDAITAWREAEHKHPDDVHPPLGAPVFWQGGNHGHIAMYVGDVDIRSTDCTATGRVSDAHGSWVHHTWGYEYLGWTGDLNGVRLPLDDEGDDDDMSKYASFGGPGIVAKPDNTWRTVKLDDERADPDGIHYGDAGALHIGKANYVAMVALTGNRHDEPNATLLVRWTEHRDDNDDMVAESTPHEYVLSGGATDLRDTFVDQCAADRYVKAQVMARNGQVDVEAVSVKIVYAPK